MGNIIKTPVNIDFAGDTNDNTPYPYSWNIQLDNVLDNLQGILEKMFHWFSKNHFVANSGKCHFLTSSKMPVNIRISKTEILNEEKVRLLGVCLR